MLEYFIADGLSIKEVAEQTGLAPGTIRMWEQRYGFPMPRGTPSGYRRHELEDTERRRPARRRAVGAGGERGAGPRAGPSPARGVGARRARARRRDATDLRPSVD